MQNASSLNLEIEQDAIYIYIYISHRFLNPWGSVPQQGNNLKVASKLSGPTARDNNLLVPIHPPL